MAFPFRKYEWFVPVESSSVVLPFWHNTMDAYAEKMSFGSQLKAAREAKGLTQQELGKGLGTNGKDASKSVVYGWEKDQHYPRTDQLERICSRLGCSADYLLFGVETPVKLSPETARLAQEIDAFEGKLRGHVIHLCNETIQFVRGLGREPDAGQGNSSRKSG